MANMRDGAAATGFQTFSLLYEFDLADASQVLYRFLTALIRILASVSTCFCAT